MKNFKTALAVFIAASLPLALFATPSSASHRRRTTRQPCPEACTSPRLRTEPSSSTDRSRRARHVQLYANYPNGNFTVSFYKQDGASWTKIGQVASNSSGNAYYPNYTITSGDQTIFAETSTDLETNTRTITGTATPQSTTATLDPPTNGGKNWTAHFGGPAVPGKATQLQIQRIYTHEVSDVDAVDPFGLQDQASGRVEDDRHEHAGRRTATRTSPSPARTHTGSSTGTAR